MSTTPIKKDGPGRPPGSIQTASTLVRGELRQSAATMGKVRMFIEEQLAECKKLLKDANLETRLHAIETISGVSEHLVKAMESAAKHLITKGAGEEERGGGGESEQEIIARLMESK